MAQRGIHAGTCGRTAAGSHRATHSSARASCRTLGRASPCRSGRCERPAPCTAGSRPCGRSEGMGGRKPPGLAGTGRCMSARPGRTGSVDRASRYRTDSRVAHVSRPCRACMGQSGRSRRTCGRHTKASSGTPSGRGGRLPGRAHPSSPGSKESSTCASCSPCTGCMS
jgi:hypothetical protein